MVLTKEAIEREIEAGRIEITPLEPGLFNPNSVNVRLDDTLVVYDIEQSSVLTRLARRLLPEKWCDLVGVPQSELDPAKGVVERLVKIPQKGLVLKPGTLYIGSTVERTYSPYHVPLYEGRSSMARLGLESHVCAGWGDVGFDGQWTLEIRVTYPTRVYPHMEIGQVGFIEVSGEIDPYGSETFQSSYQNQTGPTGYRGAEKMRRKING